MKQLLPLLLLLAFGVRAQDQPQSHTFTLDEAIAHALQHNRSVINAGRDIQSAEQKKWETTAAGLPQINAAVDYTNNFDLQKSLIPAEFFGGQPGTFIAVAFGTKHSMNARATLSQLIFDGSYIVALQASKTYLQYYHNLKERNDKDVRQMVINAYGNVLLAEESIAVLQNNKTTLDKTLHDTRETFKNGLTEEENVEQLEITSASIESSLNNARRMKDISYNMLKLALGIDLQDSLTLTDKLEDLANSQLGASFSAGDFDIKNTIDYKIGVNFTEQRRLELAREKSTALPSLSANLNLGTLAYRETFDFTHTDKPWLEYSSLNVGLNIPIFSSFARHARTQQAKIAYEQAKTQLTETEQQLKLQYQQAKSQYEFAVEDYATKKNSLALAQRIENKQQVKFTEGLSTSFDFNDAQRQLYTAQQEYLQAMASVISTKASLDKITN